MQITMKIDYIDGRHVEGRVLPRQFADFEKWNGGVGIPAWSQEPTLTGIYMLGFLTVQGMHKAGNHEGAIAASFDRFLDAIEDVDMEMEEDGVPLDVAPTLSE